MSNRINSGGEYASASGVRGARNGKSERQPAESAASTFKQATTNVTSSFESWVKAAPGKSLLIALAAGLAIGIWVKRS